ncbi:MULTISPECIES: bifunctional diaminohydroxyphosphoribosylaminopyrimidine deaminase/5-amino-6-(5-phosphoribosylamino)uracil reductase RibD [unclassified Caulobacter]|uniref:bifunctional diaminohydroxyphosphoribosylaminopyrimidine deaminase/5-amino-6-(5-phosphoribosylamino)uracil reductase RibD n=1 Tax=unclassified Caulobacter TaxID=2648921 RepID=UPI000D39ADD5|nr:MULTISPECIES: bifunctional diaminohydroxyphosphoribosylaminopyrimidine deaminase/5-amino-6-(5-phosphoribosylamino)uracil reductase RibD [unclassified Caulobacter]PTS88944.1 bifunctional diaminohydroxyphosphoribosylaminopyrimidine deaminase/5-amino-6-(5-phosphoribosylamino)uracil reductase RibD [Caulobacter sp. HMWF009]PTT08347.1 bifunctional diaminohydroxyphosphoribosylaminopyrimidine deaminase/5-amino-6-(5-phosphoribosylamino)uracil reductase RibD [Caulobacter sp. HMWF025]PTT84187.1 bifuncti
MTPSPAPSTQPILEGFRHALAAAEAYVGATAPNPPVGCTVLDADGRILATAAHQKAGTAHAEAAALALCRQAGTFEQIDTLLVTLEPCNHQGRTPPCVEAILASPARTIWIASRDPNPAVAGGGAARLAAQGRQVFDLARLNQPEAAELVRRADRLIAPFVCWSTRGRPWLTLKQALTFGGEMVPPAGAKTFTSPTSLDFAHNLRRRADAIITGSGTVLADDPLFTVRRVADPRTGPRRLAILDRRRRVPTDYLRAARTRGLEASLHDSIPAVLDDLAAAGTLEALVECGPSLLAAFLAADLWDEHVVIRQSDPDGRADRIDIHTRLSPQDPRSADVFRNH